MELEMEAVDEQILKHEKRLFTGYKLGGFGLDVEALSLDPRWSAGDLKVAESVGQAKQTPNGKIRRCDAAIGC